MGDPAGIGPDVVLEAAAASGDEAALLLIGDPELLRARVENLGLGVGVRPVETLDGFRDRPTEAGFLCCVPCGQVEPGLTPGRPRVADGRAALECIKRGAELAVAGSVDALVTAPVSKDSIAHHEPGFLGHTEYLAGLAGIDRPIMLFAAPRQADSTGAAADIALLTTHLPMATALSLIRVDLVADTLVRLGEQWAAAFGRAPAIGLAALNPHAGESGRIGTEESRLLAPALARARDLAHAGDRRVDVRGPYPADSIFLRDDLDVILALYHDQGTIMAKRAPWPTVNLTLGLPYVRTSPDHGTAYELAATGQADPAAMIAALQMASFLARGRSSADV